MATLRQIIDDLASTYGGEQRINVDSEYFGPADEYTIEEFEDMCEKLWPDEMSDDFGYISWYPWNPPGYEAVTAAVYDNHGNPVITIEEV